MSFSSGDHGGRMDWYEDRLLVDGELVAAEGAATQDAWELLAECGCDEAQGDLVAGPMPAAELAAWLERRAAGAGFRRQ